MHKPIVSAMQTAGSTLKSDTKTSDCDVSGLLNGVG